MEKAVENLDVIIAKSLNESLRESLVDTRKILNQEKSKIWLRTKTGKPYAEKCYTLSENLLNLMDGKIEQIEAALIELMNHAEIIQEESRNRSMVVT
jgi:hypothetical protein